VPGFAVQSRSFWPAASGQPVGAAEWNTAYSELVYPSKGIAFGYREGDYKVVHIDWDMWRQKTLTMLFHVGRDPFEQRDLAAARPNLLRSLQARMKAARFEHQSQRVEPLGPELDENATERLRALGYID
jgi:arylsulfatase A-like enzyme